VYQSAVCFISARGALQSCAAQIEDICEPHFVKLRASVNAMRIRLLTNGKYQFLHDLKSAMIGGCTMPLRYFELKIPEFDNFDNLE
jgi:hypothetical protein